VPSPAAQARPVSRSLGGSGGWIVFDILPVREARRADWPAVDAGRAHAGEEAAVIGWVATDASSVAFLKIEHRRLLQGAD